MRLLQYVMMTHEVKVTNLNDGMILLASVIACNHVDGAEN